MSSSNKTVISKLLDDLTHLEINTIIKKGMTSAPQPEEIEEVLYILLADYKERLEVIIKRNDLRFPIDEDKINSFGELYENLDRMNRFMDQNDIRIEEGDYIIFMRMKAFCNYLRSRQNDIKIIKQSGSGQVETIYTANLKNFANLTIDMNSRDRVMIKRIFDLGTERIVMQTRIGIDGDVVTRIEENFSNRPRQVVLDLHDKHTDLSLKYWQSLINIVRDLVRGIIRK
jgi:hypothetical protein